MRNLPQFRGQHPTARTVALAVLLDGRRREGFAQELLDRHLDASGLSAPDRRLATQLVYGVLRRRGTLQAILEPLVARPPDKVEVWLWDALRLGAYQLLLLDQIPAHAAINETVELAVQFDRPGAKGFLNGILRAVSRLATSERGTQPAANALPVAENGAQYRLLTQPALPDPAQQPVEYLSVGFGLPLWLTRRWSARWSFDECLRLGFWFASPAPLTLRINPLRTNLSAYLAACNASDISSVAGTHPQAIHIRTPSAVRDLPGYAEGWFCVQDQTAMRVASALAPEPGWHVLDLCAAPGGKSTHVAELMGDRGRVVACDPDRRRLGTVAQLAARLGLTSLEMRVTSRTTHDAPPGPFDAVLVDVPCSNTGVLGRRPEVRDRLRPDDLAELTALQGHLLRAAAERVRPGGVVVYSTCSIEPEENRAIVAKLLTERTDFTLEAEETSIPGSPADGGYYARLRRASGS